LIEKIFGPGDRACSAHAGYGTDQGIHWVFRLSVVPGPGDGPTPEVFCFGGTDISRVPLDLAATDYGDVERTPLHRAAVAPLMAR